MIGLPELPLYLRHETGNLILNVTNGNQGDIDDLSSSCRRIFISSHTSSYKQQGVPDVPIPYRVIRHDLHLVTYR